MKNKQIEALEKLLVIKDDTIKELERQVQLLKNQPTITVPQFQPHIPSNPIPVYPNQPVWPLYPSQPWWGTVTSTSPSVSATWTVTNDVNQFSTHLTNSNGTTQINWDEISRC